MLDDIVTAVAERIPKLNKYLLVDFIEQNINSATSFIDTTFRDAVKLNNHAVQYHNYQILDPYQRAQYEIFERRPVLTMEMSELRLVQFNFTHGTNSVRTLFYVPYMHNRMLVIKGKRYSVNLGISEQVFSRTIDKYSNGVRVRPIRAPIPFNRKDTDVLDDEARQGQRIGKAFIVHVLLHSKKGTKRKKPTTVLLYLLCKFGLKKTLRRFGLDEDCLSFTDHINYNDEEHAYILAKKRSKTNQLYMKINRQDVSENQMLMRVAVNIIYILKQFDFHTARDLMDPSGHIYKMMLGKILDPSASPSRARSDMDTHLASVDVFIDPISRKRFNDFGIKVNDIYDLLVYTFHQIDRLMVNSTSQDLYHKRVDITDGVMVPSYATTIFSKFYKTNQKPVLQDREVDSLMKMRPMAIDAGWGQKSRYRLTPRNITVTPQIYNDNWLASCGIFKTRPSGSPDERFHPSMAVVESIMAFSGAVVGQTGSLNPFCPISENGGILRPDYADDIDEIKSYLPLY